MNTYPQTSTRDYWFDNAKALLIFLVVIGHLAEILINRVDFPGGTPNWLWTTYRGIYSFHMPVFLIISGRFSRKRIDHNDWVSVFNKLVIPYILAQTLMMFAYAFFNYASIASFSYLSPMFGLWYLLAIALYQLVTPWFSKIKGYFWISIILMFIFAFGKVAPFGIFMRFIMFYPFFLFGYLTSTKKLDFCKRWWFRIVSICAIIALIILVSQYSDCFKVSLLTGKRVYWEAIKYWNLTKPQYALFLFARYSLGFICYFLLLGICPSKKIFSTCLGTNSTYIYILHLFIIIGISGLHKYRGFLNLFASSKRAFVFVLMGLPLSFLLVSKPVKALTRWLISPSVDIRKIFSKLLNQTKQ